MILYENAYHEWREDQNIWEIKLNNIRPEAKNRFYFTFQVSRTISNNLITGEIMTWGLPGGAFIYGNYLFAELFGRKHKNIFVFLVVSEHQDGTGMEISPCGR